MDLFKALFINISVLFTYTYLIHVVYKNVVMRHSLQLRYIFSIVVFIAAGWLMMLFSYEIGEARFDLRIMPVILALFVFKRPGTFVTVAAAIGLLRLSFGFDWLGFFGFLTMLITGLVAEAVAYGFSRRPGMTFGRKAVAAVLALNAVRVLLVPVFKAFPARTYFLEIFPVHFPVGVALGFLFLFIVRDFQMRQRRAKEYGRANRLLRIRTNDLHEAKQDLERQNTQLEAATRYKSEFLANMSHELKTPLNSILLLSQLQGEDDTAEQDRIRYGNLIHHSGQELLKLITDILDLTKVESGKLDITEERVSLRAVCRTLEEQFRPLAESRGLTFECAVHGDVPEWTWTDPVRVNQILRNLLGNAFKFTENGSVALNVEVEAAGDGAREAVFRVADTGVGIVPDQHEAIFEAFQQEDGSISRKYGGSGLGLAISRQLAALLGGRIEVESEKGAGSCFTFRLPLRVREVPSEQGELDGFARWA